MADRETRPLVRCDIAGQPKSAEEAQDIDVWVKAMAMMPGGVLPLSKAWLSEKLHDLFGSERTAATHLADLKVQKSTKSVTSSNETMYIRECHIPSPKIALYRLDGQKRPSKVLVRHDVEDPMAALSELLGAEVVVFEMEETPVTEIAAPVESTATPDVPTEATIAWPVEPGQLLGMLVTLNDDDDEPTPRVISVDFVCQDEVSASVGAPG